MAPQATEEMASDATLAEPDPHEELAAEEAEGIEQGEVPAPAAVVAVEAGEERAAELAQPAEKTLWLVQPLYPGQELLVSRTEELIGKLFPEGQRETELVGRRELGQGLGDGSEALECIFGSVKCTDPIGALVTGFGVHRVVMIRVGQEGAGYRFRVASFQPGSFEAATAENEDAKMERALLGAIVRVAPLAAVVEVQSDPPGATVLVDGEKIGVTPISAQVLPGERVIRLEKAFYEPSEITQVIPIRGQVQVEESLAALPGKLRVVSAGARIYVDGEHAGDDEVETGATPGVHTVRLERDGYEPYETQVEVKAEGVAEVNRTLEPTFWQSVVEEFGRAHKEIYDHDGYVAFVYDDVTLQGDKFSARLVGLSSTKLDGVAMDRKAKIQSFGVEYGSLWRNVGMVWIGGAYFRSADDWTYNKLLDGEPGTTRGEINGGTLRLLQPQLRLAVWRFILGARGGFLGRVGTVSDSGDSFLFADLGAEARGSLQLHIFKGLYIEGGYGRTWTLTGSTEGTEEIRGGIGYAF